MPLPPPPPSPVPSPVANVGVAVALSRDPAHIETAAVMPLCPPPPVPLTHSLSTWKPQTDKPYMCSKCGKNLSNSFTLKRHHEEFCGKVRNTSGKWKCEHCPRTYKTEGNLARHTRYECGVPRQFYCVFCNRAFTQRCSLSRHLKNFHRSADGMVTQRDVYDQTSSIESDGLTTHQEELD